MAPLDTKKAVSDIENLPNVNIEIGPLDAMCILGTIQLALRHPGNIGPCSKVSMEFATRLINYLSVSDEVNRLCEKGWDLKWPIGFP